MNYRQEEPSGNMFLDIVIILAKAGFLRALAILKQSVASLRFSPTSLLLRCVATRLRCMQSCRRDMQPCIVGAKPMHSRDTICGAPLWPEDVAMIRGLVREHCEILQCARQGAEAEDSAKLLLGWFQGGVTDRDSLRRLLRPI